MSASLLPRARLADVLRGNASLIGSRLDPAASRGWVSPVEARIHLGIPYGQLLQEERSALGRRRLATDLGIVTRATLARTLAPAGDAVETRRPWVVSSHLDNVSIDEALDELLAPPLPIRARMAHFVHPHCLNLACTNPKLAGQLARADLNLPDGVGIRVAARLLRVAMHHNLNGTDLWPALVRRAQGEKLPLAFIGAAPGVAERCANRLREENPGLKIALVSHGYLDAHASDALVTRVRTLGRCLVLVGMGSPRQETWAWRHLSGIPGLTVVTVGGLFDFISGDAARAPVAWRELGLEWLFRLTRDPRRLWRRYIVGNPLFLLRVLRQRLRGAPASQTERGR